MSSSFPAERDCLSLGEWDPSLWLLPVCCSAVSSWSWFLGELRQKNPNQEWNKVRIYYGKDLAGCQRGGFVSKALCVLVLLIRNESKGLTRVRETDKFPVWGVGSSQMNSHSCPWCLHSRAQHFPSSRNTMISGLSLSLGSCCRHTSELSLLIPALVQCGFFLGGDSGADFLSQCSCT